MGDSMARWINNPMQSGAAIPFVTILDNKDQSGYHFKLEERAIDVFRKLKDKKIAVAVVAGPQRTGKSFLSNRLLHRMKGFAVGPSTLPCTKGLWLWGQPVVLKDDSVLLIVDTEGLNSVQRDENIDSKIFALSILLSSVFVYNCLGHIDEKALETMSAVLRITDSIRTKLNDSSASNIPEFCWVLRDFSLDLKGMSESDYLESSLMPVSPDKNDPRNQIRAKIKSTFVNRRCECLPRPVNEEEKLANIELLEFEQLRPKFKERMLAFEKTFYELLPLKRINGRLVTAEVYVGVISEYIEALNNKSIPEICNILERTVSAESKKIALQLAESYKEGLQKLELPMDEAVLNQNHANFKTQILQRFDSKLQPWLDLAIVTQERKVLENQLNNLLQELKKENTRKNEQKCYEIFSKFCKSYQMPKLNSFVEVGSLYETLTKAKLEEIIKIIKYHFYTCKAPRKFLESYFLEKYPQQIFELFGRLCVRINELALQQMKQTKQMLSENEQRAQLAEELVEEQNKLIRSYENEIKALKRRYDQHFQEESEESTQVTITSPTQRRKNQLNNLTKGASNSQPIEPIDGQLPYTLHDQLKSVKEEIDSIENFMKSVRRDLQAVPPVISPSAESAIAEAHKQAARILETRNKEVAQIRKKCHQQSDRIKQEYEISQQIIQKHIESLKSQNINLREQLKTGRHASQNIKQMKNTLNSKDHSISDLQKEIEQLHVKLDMEQVSHIGGADL